MNIPASHPAQALIAQRFAKAADSYAQHAVIQKAICQQLIGLMVPHVPAVLSRVLELGCGCGNLTKLLQQNFQIEQLILNDLYAEVKLHFSATERLNWCIGDIEQLAFPPSLDAIMSSSALQWMNDLEQVLIKCQQALKIQGWLCFSSFGPQNLTEIKSLTGQGLNYLTLTEIKAQLQRSGFEIVEIQEERQTLYFDHPRQVLQHLKLTGVTATGGQYRWSKQSLQEFYEGYAQFRGTAASTALAPYPLTYHPIYCIARRVR